ncbi:uncharacterized protein BDR25DRAFT_267112 [Lindgomyces ingoldianus]|uniref:Uncharacterized protein n=1 Tax=Lindgomyces ingoldianus TaxID=673940 RepID=A0ACB6QKY9_9PLEO|nr:uncharacterized protein BDR25DRAFT_267112 [Lindgomyces ingoldianus]KAF2467581.1 hypothetical protein BDR25DRAFT_267112 [Lindgomyces ingoldianus]
MLHFYETNEALYEASQETTSRDRPPQLNQTVCGCWSGSGCNHIVDEGVDSGRSSSEDGASTQMLETLGVASDHSEIDEVFPPCSDDPEEHVSLESFAAQRSSFYPEEEIREIRTKFGGFLNSTEGFRLSQHAIGIEERPMHVHRVHILLHDGDDAANSMRNEPNSSDDHSIVTSENMSVRCMSPGPGLGSWIEDRVNGYHFLDSPLRLTPQRRYCRGLVASHLVLRDDMVCAESAEGFLEDSSKFGGFR